MKNMWEPWDNVFNLIAEDIFNLKNLNNKTDDNFKYDHTKKYRLRLCR